MKSPWKKVIDDELLAEAVGGWDEMADAIAVFPDQLRHVQGISFHAVFLAPFEPHYCVDGDVRWDRLLADATRLSTLTDDAVSLTVRGHYCEGRRDFDGWLLEVMELVRDQWIKVASPVFEALLKVLDEDQAYGLMAEVLERQRSQMAAKLQRAVAARLSELEFTENAVVFLWNFIRDKLFRLLTDEGATTDEQERVEAKS